MRHLHMTHTFKQAADALCLSGDKLAELLGVTLQTVRQARLSPQAKGYRTPPAGWEGKLAKVAKRKARELERLAEELEG